MTISTPAETSASPTNTHAIPTSWHARALPPPALHVVGVHGRTRYGLEGRYEVHLHGQGRKERAVKGDGVLMNGNGQHLQTEGRVYGDSSGVAIGGHRDGRHSNRNGNAMDGWRLDSSTVGYELREVSRGGQLTPPSP
jgi:hypothetical protein